MHDSQPDHQTALEPDHTVQGSPLLRLFFWLYKRVLSPVVHAISPTQCLYLPTCSEYAYVALSRFGPWRGGWLAVRRLLRCHPFAKGGLDPVPQRTTSSDDLSLLKR